MHMVAVLVVLLTFSGCINGQEEYNAPVNLGRGVTLQWAYNGFAITLKISAPTRGWVGIGFSPGRTMRGSDLIIAGIDDRQVPYVFDAHSMSNMAPLLDRSPDVSILDASQTGSRTTVTLKRAQVIDDNDDISLKPGKTNVIWAFGSEDLTEQPTSENYHYGNRGFRALELIPASSGGNVQPVIPGQVENRVPFRRRLIRPPPTAERNIPTETNPTVKSQVFIFPFVDPTDSPPRPPSSRRPFVPRFPVGVSTSAPTPRTPRTSYGAPTNRPTARTRPRTPATLPTNRPTVRTRPRTPATPPTNRRTARTRPRIPATPPTNKPTTRLIPRFPSTPRTSTRRYIPPRTRPSARPTTKKTASPYDTFIHQNTMTLDRYGLVVLHWSIFGRDLVLEMEAPTLGWMGVGFSPSGTMVGADLIIMGVRQNRGYVLDTHATRNGPPIEDDSQDVDLLQSSQNGTYTRVMVFRRSHETDAEDIRLRPGKMNVIWAYGRSDIADVPGTNDYHASNRGSTMIEFIPVRSLGNVEISSAGRNAGGPTGVSVAPRRPAVAPSVPDEAGEDLASSGASSSSSQTFALSGFQVLDRERMVTMRWGKKGTSLILEMTAPTLGWIGLGFSPSGTMVGADLIMAGAGIYGAYSIEGYAKANGIPTVDESKDVTLLGFKENGTHTTIMFLRELNTGHENDTVLKSGPMNIIWAFGGKDMTNEPARTDYHFKNRGSAVVTLYPGDSKEVKEVTEVKAVKKMKDSEGKEKEEEKEGGEEKKEEKKEEDKMDEKKETRTVPPSTTTEKVVETGEQEKKHVQIKSKGQESRVGMRSLILAPMPPVIDVSNQVKLGKDERVVLRWGVDENYLVLEMTAPTLGWVGVGFSPTGTMEEADIIMMGVGKNGAYALDAYGTANTVPTVDPTQDVTVMSHNETDTLTTVTVMRKLDTMDENDMFIEDIETHLIWAYGEQDPEDGLMKELYHSSNRGMMKLNLINPSTETTGSSADYITILAASAAILLILGLAGAGKKL